MKEKNNQWGSEIRMSGFFMILLGLIYFLATFDMIGWGSILISIFFASLPGVWAVSQSWREVREYGYLSRRSIIALMWALFPFAFISLMFSGVNVGRLWPLAVVMVGLSILIGDSGPKTEKENG